jgi:1-acyl-sn-glycerol-3-phosphate acyltransferase
LPLITNIIPKRTKITCVVGAPISVPHIPNPTKEQVLEYLQIYKEKLTELYDANKAKYNDPPTKQLEII